MGTGGGPPKVKVLTSLEMELLDFLTPEASGLDIAQGGFQYLTSDVSNKLMKLMLLVLLIVMNFIFL